MLDKCKHFSSSDPFGSRKLILKLFYISAAKTCESICWLTVAYYECRVDLWAHGIVNRHVLLGVFPSPIQQNPNLIYILVSISPVTFVRNSSLPMVPELLNPLLCNFVVMEDVFPVERCFLSAQNPFLVVWQVLDTVWPCASTVSWVIGTSVTPRCPLGEWQSAFPFSHLLVRGLSLPINSLPPFHAMPFYSHSMLCTKSLCARV